MSMHVATKSECDVAIVYHFLLVTTFVLSCLKTGMLAIIPLYYHFTKEENNEPSKNNRFRLDKIKKDYELRRLWGSFLARMT